MHTRRKFLLQGSLAAAAFMATKSLKAMNDFANPFLGEPSKQLNLTILHGSSSNLLFTKNNLRASQTQNPIVLVHGKETEQSFYDAGNSQPHSISTLNGYKIIMQNNIKVGVISVLKSEQGLSTKVNRLSSFLKNKKGCQLVVCMSQLGYKNNKSIDDRILAAHSENVDMIIGKYSLGSPKHPMVLLNSKSSEVIVQHTQYQEKYLEKINIGFDSNGKKYTISF